MGRLTWVFFMMLIATYVTGPLTDPDLWWHLNVGRWILDHGALPTVDLWTRFGNGQAWRAYSWSNEVLFALAYRVGDIPGLAVLNVVYALLFVSALAYFWGWLARNYFFGALLAGSAVSASFEHISLRPQLLSWVFLIGMLALIETRREKPRMRDLLLFGLLAVAWANTHITAGIGVLFACGWGFTTRSSLQSLIPFFIAGAIGLFVTPYFGGELLTLFHTSSHPFAYASIAEFQPATILMFSAAYIVLLGAFAVALKLGSDSTISKMRWFITIVTLLIAFTVVKFMPIAIITLGTLVAKRWRTLSAERAIDLNIREAFLKLKDGYEWLPKQGVAFLLLCLTILNLNQTLRAPINLIETPQAAVDFMLQSGLPGPLLNTFGDGGYVSFRYSGNDGVPSELVAIDGRTNLISKDIFAEYEATFFGREGWRSFVARVRPKTILWPTQSPLTALLLNSGEYTRIYRDMNPAGMSVFTMRE